MFDRDRSPHPDSHPDHDHDRRSDVEQAVDGDDARTPLKPTGVPDGVAGTGGVTKNQDDTAQ